jgi:hypothetical protein
MHSEWKFGQDQTPRQELAEINKAHRHGLAVEYMQRQRWARLIEAETTRRRHAKTAA